MRWFVVLISFCFLFSAKAQDTIDTNQRYVRKAILFSAVLPGAGQVLNHMNMPKGKRKAFWKVPIIYAGLGFTMYSLINNNNQRIRLKEEYLFRDENAGTLYPEYDIYDQSGVLTLHDQRQTFRDLSILGFSAVYLLQVLDAGVEAHFVHFDISEDLSMTVAPTLLSYRTPGVGIKLNFR